MNEFQKIAIGLLGLTHPELFVPSRKQASTVTSAPASAFKEGQAAPVKFPERPLARLVQAVKFGLSALAIGARTVALADNSELLKELGERARCLYGSGGG